MNNKDKGHISDFDHNTPHVKNEYFNAATQLDGAKHEMEDIYGKEDELRRLKAIKDATEQWIKYHERETNVLRRVIRTVTLRLQAFDAVNKSREGIKKMTDEFDPDIRIEAYGSDNTLPW